MRKSVGGTTLSGVAMNIVGCCASLLKLQVCVGCLAKRSRIAGYHASHTCFGLCASNQLVADCCWRAPRNRDEGY